jgi:hypothetical protein
MRRTTAPLLAVALLVLAAAPATAKEWLEAELDAPIAMGTPAGTEILVGLTVTVPEGLERPAVDAATISLTLLGPTGHATRAIATADGPPNHYTARIAIPEAGARDLVIAVPGAEELPVVLRADPFTFGPISARTAQLAPLGASAADPVTPAASARPAAAPVPTDSPATLAALVLLALAAAGLAARSIAARRRTPTRPAAPSA